MIWLKLFVTGTCCLIAALVYLLVSTVIKSRRALARYKKVSGGLPILEGANPLMANHGVEFHLGRQVSQKLTKRHEQYGKTFGFLIGTRPCASTIDLDLIKLIVLDESQSHLDRMPFYTAMPEIEKDCIISAEGEQWRRIRQAFGPSLKRFKLPNMINEIEESITKMMQSLENKLEQQKSSGSSSLEIKLDDVIHRYSQDVVYRCLYKQNKMIDYEADKCDSVELVDDALDTPKHSIKVFPVKMCMVFPAIMTYVNIFLKNFTHLIDWKLMIVRFIGEQTELALKARKELKEREHEMTTIGKEFDRDNFKLKDGTQFKRFVIDFIIDHYLDGKLTRNEYINSSFFLFNAADKTVCDVMINALYYLSIETEIQQKLRNSIQTSGMESEYLSWVLNETMRLHPAATVGCSRSITRDIKLNDGGYTLPAGTFVHTPLYTIHRHEQFWGQDANKFRPERWADSAQFHPMQFIPFGAGRRSCPGKDLALFEMKSLFAKLMTRYKFEADEKDDLDIFDSPYTLYTLHNSPTFVRISHL